MTSASPSQARILVVDDDRATVTLVARVLARAGHAVVTAHDGESALARFAEGQRFDVVVLDRRLPGMDGLEVLRRLKASPDLRNIPVVLATAMATQEEIWEGVRAGAFYYLPKPLGMDLMLQIIEAASGEAFARRKLWAEMALVRSAIGLIHRGTFHYRTMRECEELAMLLANACPDPQRSFVGLFELMLNGHEHGNLGITYADKTALVEARTWKEELLRREELPENRRKRVTVTLSRTLRTTRFVIQDEGPGFDWEAFQTMDPERLLDNHGRGILLARWEAFDQVDYLGSGNQVRMVIRHPAP